MVHENERKNFREWNLLGTRKLLDKMMQCVKHDMRKRDVSEQVQINVGIDRHFGVISVLEKHLSLKLFT